MKSKLKDLLSRLWGCLQGVEVVWQSEISDVLLLRLDDEIPVGEWGWLESQSGKAGGPVVSTVAPPVVHCDYASALPAHHLYPTQ